MLATWRKRDLPDIYGRARVAKGLSADTKKARIAASLLHLAPEVRLELTTL
ncbi:MAG: hypothetical protein WB784_02935 [Rhodanobacteraceae bacterium]